jgi:uncharacterized protein (DUF58 family)
VRRSSSPRLAGYAGLVAVGLVAALALRRPELAVVAAPFALLLALGTAFARDPQLEVDFSLETDRSFEGAEILAEITLRSGVAIDRLELLLELPDDIEVVDHSDAMAIRLPAGVLRTVPITLRCKRWGVYTLGKLEIRARDRLRIVVWEDTLEQLAELKVYPTPETLTRIVSPVETQAFVGSEVARVKGDGIEYADIRDYAPGDRLRAINWRASARKGSLVVNERHPERNTDVVLFVDSFLDVRGERRSTLDDAIRATATLARLYLERRDRVGLVTFGGILSWLQPGTGPMQRYRLVEALLETGIAPDYTWRDVNLIPARILPPKALVVGITPLVDPRYANALENLRARGFDVVVIELDAVPLVEPGRSEIEKLAYRLWVLEREVLSARLERLGIGIARWGEERSLEAALEEVRTYRRYARVARV